MKNNRNNRNDSLRKTYGFDEISISPSGRTVDPVLCNIKSKLANHELDTPIMASAMDSVVSPQSAAQLAQNGVLGVLNLHGLWTRYADADAKLLEISHAKDDEFVPLMQKLYSQPIKDELIAQRIGEMKHACSGKKIAVSSIPQDAQKLEKIAYEAGCDFFFVQSTVTSTRHMSNHESLNISELCHNSKMPIIVGNCVNFDVALELMEAGVAGVLVGIGPGAACTSRGVLGIGVPMATTIMDCCDARDYFYSQTGKYVSIVADGGIINSGDICKSIACGADFVMLGSLFAKADGAPGHGYHWGMATPSPVLPRGTRVRVGTIGSYQEIIHGPARLDNGFHNILGAIKTSMGTLGAQNIKEMQSTDVIIAQSILTEGKAYQSAQKLGMGNKK